MLIEQLFEVHRNSLAKDRSKEQVLWNKKYIKNRSTDAAITSDMVVFASLEMAWVYGW